MIRKIFTIILFVLIVFAFLSIDYSGNSGKDQNEFTYGVSFSRFHSDELGLDWKETYLAILNDLKVRNFRFSAHWPLTEPEEGKFNFTELDFQMNEARKKDAAVILAVGRRLPGWPECHEPEWVRVESEKLKVESEKQKYKQERILKYVEKVVERYKDYPNLKYWQVENEAYLTFFSRSACGELDESFLEQEIRLVKSLDPDTPVLLTDSGEIGTWYNAYRKGDAFGTSMYLYIWNHTIGKFRYPITYHFFRIKQNLIKLFFKPKPMMVIELSTEPWLIEPITEVPFDVQLERMNIDKFNEVLSFSTKTGFDTFYLWGAEWWYWLSKNGYAEHWEKAKTIFND